MDFLKYFTQSPDIPKIIPDKKEPPKPVFPKVEISNFVKSSLNFIPVQKDDYDRLKMPFVCAVTPIPFNDEDIQVPQVSYNYEDAPKCPCCSTLASKKSIICPDKVSYLCNICSNKCQFGINADQFVNSAQLNVPVVQFPCEAKENEKNRVKNVLILEKTFPTVEKGLFNEVVKKMLEKIETLNEGLYSFFVLTTGLTVPSLSNDRKSYNISVYPDAAGAILHNAEKVFFDLSTEKELFINCVKHISEEVQPSVPLASVFDVIESVTSSFEGCNVFSTMVTSTANTGEMNTAKELGNKLLLTNGHFDLFCMNPAPSNQPDYAPLAEFSMLNNSHLTVFNSIQVGNIIDDIIYRLFCRKSGGCLVLSTQPKYIGVKDISGCGIRRTANAFILTAAEPGDTVYFLYEYIKPKIEIPVPTFSFQMKLMNEDGTKVIRTAIYSFSLVNNMATVMKKIDYDVIVASHMIQAIEAGREASDEFKMQDEIVRLRKSIFEDNFVKVMLYVVPDMIRYLRISFAVMKKLVNFVRAAEVMSKSPTEFSRYIAPKGYIMNLGDIEPQTPDYIHQLYMDSGALFVQYDNSHSVVLLSQNEDIGKWAAALTEQPLNLVLLSISTARSLELMHPSLSKESKVFVTINKCMTAPVEEDKPK